MTHRISIAVLVALVALLSSCQEQDQGGYTPEQFHDAVNDQELTADQLRALIENGADVNAVDLDSGVSPLERACFQRPHDVVEVLIDAGADVYVVDYRGQTLLHWAATGNSDPMVIKLLVEAGLDVDARNSIGSTPLHMALENNVDVLEMLLDLGADINARQGDQENGPTALGMAIYGEILPLESTSLLLARGADANIKDANGMTALDDAENIEIFKGTAVLEQLRAATTKP